jgi:hypothetical protein
VINSYANGNKNINVGTNTSEIKKKAPVRLQLGDLTNVTG